MYFIIEIQTTKQGSAIAPIPGYENKDKAISGYYYKLVYASDPDLSKCDIHTVMLIDNLGEVIMKDVFAHEIPVEEPTEEVPEEQIEEELPEEPIEEQAEEPIEEEPSEEPVEEVEEEPSEEPVAEEPIDEPIEEEPEEEVEADAE